MKYAADRGRRSSREQIIYNVGAFFRNNCRDNVASGSVGSLTRSGDRVRMAYGKLKRNKYVKKLQLDRPVPPFHLTRDGVTAGCITKSRFVG